MQSFAKFVSAALAASLLPTESMAVSMYDTTTSMVTTYNGKNFEK